jgi:hypothetical protein
VTKDVPDYGLVYGNPAHLRGFIAPNGQRLSEKSRRGNLVFTNAPGFEKNIEIPIELWERVK